MLFAEPRSLFVEYLEYYDNEEKRQNAMLGFTGLSPLEMGNSDKCIERLQFDVTSVQDQWLKWIL